MTKTETTALAKVDTRATWHLMQPVLDTVPTLEEDPTARMVEIIMEASDPSEWERLFNSASTKGNVGKEVRVHDLRWFPSAFEGGVGVFLVAEVTWLETGEQGVLATGSLIAMAQLLNCWKRKDLPRDFVILEKPTDTRAGFRPIRLRALPKRVNAADGV